MENEFENQLKEEEWAKLKDEGKQTYTDKDGTVMEWDSEKKAWFPKIDDDFIANYQMNYGNDINQGGEDGESPKKYDEEAYKQYCKEYYEYYGSENQTGSCSTTDSSSKSNINPETGEEFKDYAEYYAYYYGEEYAEYYKHFNKDEVTVPGSNQTQVQKKNKKEMKKLQLGEKRKLPPEKEDPTWFDYEAEHGTHVYVSGLPTDITQEEFQEIMVKYGLIMFDSITKEPKIKLYKDKEGNVKGDGLCCFIKKESVDLALKLLDGYEIRGSKVSVEKAKFEMKGDFDPLKKKKKLSNKQKRKAKENQEKLFDWNLDKSNFRQKHEKVVVLKNMFDMKEFETEPTLINELREDVRTECNKFGDVKKVILYDHNVDGVMSVAYKTAEEADQCIEALNGRWFGGKQILAETWDGQTKFEIEETEEQRSERLKTWDKFLVSDSGTASASITTENTTDAGMSGVNTLPESIAVTTDSSSVNISEDSTDVKISDTSVNSNEESASVNIEVTSNNTIYTTNSTHQL